ncbi:MAG TPA: FAD-binding oxidoreductase [Candidatus Paceibacterota bacterium]|nr:FAD-binding oxidoreductase [Candidatus Paceibacterota bacterium]
MSALSDDLKKVIRGEVDDTPMMLEKFSRDASLFVVKPEVIVRPKDAADVEALVRYVSEKKQVPKTHLSITARAAGTDMSGGPLTDSIVLDTTAHFNKILEVRDMRATVEPGVFFRDFDKETKKQNLELPSYTASRELNTVGGMVGNNSGGEKNLKYGKTARYVEELEVVLYDGKVHTLKKLEGEALSRKLAEDGFEGDLYRRAARIVSTAEHKKTIEAAKPHVEKNSSGYALWDIGDGTSSLNLARLMVGAQGTLGIITKIKFSLVHPKPYAAMVIMFLDSLSELGEIVPEVLTCEPDSFESYDDHTFALAVKYFPEFASQMKAGIISLGISFLPEVWMALTGGIPKLILMAEFRGHTQEEAIVQAHKLVALIKKNKSHIKVRVARNEAATRKYWTIRRESFSLLRKKIRGKRTAPFIDDFVVPPAVLPEFLPKLEAVLSKYDLTYTVAGHVGDGNFHIIPLVDPKDPTVAKTIDELSHTVYDLVLQYHGSISGEHNDGLIRTPYVEQMFGPAMYALFLEVKALFDPQNIFNPGKKVGANFSDSLAKLDLPSVQAKK